MADLKLKDFVDENDLQKLVELDNTIERVRADYVNAAKELAKGLKLNVEGVADLEKLSNLYNTQAKTAGSASAELTEALRKQSEITQTVSKKIEEKLNVEKLSAAELKKLTKANSDNAASLEKAAKAEANLTKAQNAGNITRKKAVLSEEERLKIIRSAITLTNQEVHSRSQAKEMNKQLQKAVDLLKDTDEDYIRTLARLNSTIGINTDYIKRNSDRYTQQKMTIGAYREEVKAAWVEIQNGNKSMQNMGIIARNAGKILKTEMATGLNQVSAGLKGWAAGYIGAQAVVGGIVKMFTQLREGVGSIVEFEFANSKLAAILGTTADNIKELTTDAKRLGATTKYTASEATELQIELAKLGFTRKEILDATESVLRFAQATGAGLGEAASLTGAALRMFNADTRETERYVSAMAVATTKSALSFSYLATALPIVGPVAKAFNFSIEDTLALVGKLADAGFDASMSATATRNILLNLADTNGVLAKSLGGPVRTLPELVAGLQKLKEQGVDLNSTLEMTDKRSVAAFNAFLTAADKIVPLRDQITGVDKELADMADTMSNNVKGSIAGLSSAWEAFMLSFYNSKGPMKEVLDFLAKGLRGAASQLKSYSQLQDEADNSAVARAQKEMASSNVIEKHRKNMIRLYKEKLKKGMSADEAAIAAKDEYLQTLQSQLDSENKEYSNGIKKREKLEKEVEDRGSFRKWTIYGWIYDKTRIGRTKKIIEEDIKTATTVAAGKKAIASITESIIDDLNKVDLKQSEVSQNASGQRTLTDKEKRELEKAEKEKQKIRETYQESELALMDEGLEKELAKIGVAYSKKIAAVKGNSKEEIATRQNLAKEMQEKLDEFTIKYNSDREKKDVENALAVVKKGSQEELDLKLHQLELQREAEIDAAEKTGEDVFLIDEKYAKKKQELYERHASDQVQLIAENAAHEQEIRDAAYVMDTLALKKQLASKEITQQEYAELEYQLKLNYARKTAEAAIDALESELATANLSTDKREKLEEKLAKLKADLAQKEAEAEIEAIDKVTKADEKAQKERQKNLKKWLQTASQAVGTIGNLVSSIYDGQIQKIEEEREANEEKYDEDIERIENLAESGAISEEEAEARKRAAKDQTEAKNKELERQKQEIAHKQAVWNKGVQVAETGIATARGIMEAFQLGPIAGAVMAAVIGAMGAMQVATILATPIPSYAEGTKGNDRHPGGAALVGDAGKHEVIMYSGKAWITPDTPTLVDIPKGAQVFPDVDKVDISNFDMPDWDFPTFSPTYFASSSGDTIVFNDYSRLEKRVDRTNFLLMKSLKMQRQDASNREFELYKLSKLK
ncbi:phage tail tape measure protein [Bacteroides acidifaciens]|uniref:phage tail tape measure protein n=1 Tax=Bacteroides acidifaciens TaxID=85831 RepID=UPI00258679A8|nr:phage tail tape measure protein [Bacteroides acidifaciens]